MDNQETEAVVIEALRVLIMAKCAISATILSISEAEMYQHCDTINFNEHLQDAEALTRFMDFWEDLVSGVVAESGYFRADETVVRVVAGLKDGGLVTRIYLYDETDFTDE